MAERRVTTSTVKIIGQPLFSVKKKKNDFRKMKELYWFKCGFYFSVILTSAFQLVFTQGKLITHFRTYFKENTLVLMFLFIIISKSICCSA